MANRFLSTIRPAPPEFIECELSKKLLLSGAVAVYAAEVDDVLRHVPEVDRLEGVVVTPGAELAYQRLGRLFWHMTLPAQLLPVLRTGLGVLLSAIETAAEFRDADVEDRRLVERIQYDLQVTRDDYTRVTGKLVDELGRSQALVAERERAVSEARLIAEASKVLASSLDLNDALDRLTHLVVPSLADWSVVDLLENGIIRRVAWAHTNPEMEPVVRSLNSRPLRVEEARHPAARAMASHSTYLLPEITEAELRAHTTDEVAAAVVRKLAPGAALAVPLVRRERTLGAITFALQPPRHFDAGSIAVAEEISRRVAATVESASLIAEAQEAVRVREEFLAVASHELRTPLTSLLLTIQALRRGLFPSASEEVQRFVASIERQAMRLKQLFGEMLSVTAADIPDFKLTRSEMDLAALVRAERARLTPVLEAAGCPVAMLAPGPVVGQWDKEKLRELVDNLLSNAAKFGSGRPVELSVAGMDGIARLTVVDHGIGIAPEALPHVFERFYRGVPYRSYGGLGLGLYAARRIVDAHGGLIRVDSRPGEYTTFVVDIPRAPPL